jgi:hypothetical protein
MAKKTEDVFQTKEDVIDAVTPVDIPFEEPADIPANLPLSVSKPVAVKQIHVLYGYRGERTREQFIEPGVYFAESEQLFGLAEYLVENGHAVYV